MKKSNIWKHRLLSLLCATSLLFAGTSILSCSDDDDDDDDSPAVTLSSIAVNTEKATTSYKIGDTFSTDGITVTATYTDETTKDVTSSAEFSTPDMSAEGTPEVTVSYTEGSVTKTATFSISVSATGETIVALSSIDVTSNPTLSWYTNQEFSTSGMTVTATYTDKTTKEVTSSVKVTLTDSDGNTVEYDSLTAGTLKATVSYTEGSITKTANFSVTVTKYELYSIKIDTSNAKTTFTKNGTFSSTGLTVTATYTDNTTADVTSNANTSGYVMSTTGTQTVTVSYTEDEVTKTATYTIVVQEALPYTVSGSVAKDTVVPPLAVTSETGASVSFWLGSDLSSDWTDIISTTQAWIRLSTLGSVHDSIWIGNVFEAAATIGPDFSSDYTSATAYQIFFNEAAYVTVSFDGNTVKFYKNGKLALTYDSDVTGWNLDDNVTSSVSMADFSSDVIKDIAESGLKLNPGNATVNNVTIAAAVTDTTAQTAFNEAVQTIASIAVNPTTTEFTEGGTFSYDGIITATDSNGNTFALSKNFVTFSEPDLSTAADSVAVTVTLKEKTSVTTNYNIKVVSSDSVTVPTAVYSAKLDGNDTGVEIVGAGSYVEDETFTKVAYNANGGTEGKRTNYIKLGNVFENIGGSADDSFTIGFWVKNPNSETVISTAFPWSPLFTAQNTQVLSGGDDWPCFAIEERQVVAWNWGGWNPGVGEIKREWIDDNEWHYVTVVVDGSSNSVNVYIDGIVTNTITEGFGDGNAATPSTFVAAMADATWDLCSLGGCQIASWADNDVPLYFAKFSVWNSALSAAQINKVISTTKNSD